MRALPMVLALAGVLGCAGSGSQSQAAEPVGDFGVLDGVHAVHVRLESQKAVSGTLEIFASDTAHGIYTGDLTLEELAFMGDVIAYSASSPRRELRTTLRALFNRRSAGPYATLVLFPSEEDAVAGKVTLHSTSATCAGSGPTADGGYAADPLLVSRYGRDPTNAPPTAVASSRCPSLAGTLRVVQR